MCIRTKYPCRMRLAVRNVLTTRAVLLKQAAPKSPSSAWDYPENYVYLRATACYRSAGLLRACHSMAAFRERERERGHQEAIFRICNSGPAADVSCFLLAAAWPAFACFTSSVHVKRCGTQATLRLLLLLSRTRQQLSQVWPLGGNWESGHRQRISCAVCHYRFQFARHPCSPTQ